MNEIETEGTTIDEAIEAALRELGVEREKVAIEILTDSTKGIFGLGAKKARVRAAVRRPLDTSGVSAEAAEPTASAAAAAGSAARPSRPPRPPREEESDEGPDPAVVEKARPILQEIVRLMGVPASAEVATNEEGPHLVLVGDSSGILIGRQGQTLDALEYVVNRIVSMDDEGPRRRMTVDTEGYRGRRRETLQQLAGRTAEKVVSQGRAVTLDPMSPRDRRIVHLSLQNDAHVTTRSTGDGYHRQVVVVPKGARR